MYITQMESRSHRHSIPRLGTGPLSLCLFALIVKSKLKNRNVTTLQESKKSLAVNFLEELFTKFRQRLITTNVIFKMITTPQLRSH